MKEKSTPGHQDTRTPVIPSSRIRVHTRTYHPSSSTDTKKYRQPCLGGRLILYLKQGNLVSAPSEYPQEEEEDVYEIEIEHESSDNGELHIGFLVHIRAHLIIHPFDLLRIPCG